MFSVLVVVLGPDHIATSLAMRSLWGVRWVLALDDPERI